MWSNCLPRSFTICLVAFADHNQRQRYSYEWTESSNFKMLEPRQSNPKSPWQFGRWTLALDTLRKHPESLLWNCFIEVYFRGKFVWHTSNLHTSPYSVLSFSLIYWGHHDTITLGINIPGVPWPLQHVLRVPIQHKSLRVAFALVLVFHFSHWGSIYLAPADQRNSHSWFGVVQNLHCQGQGRQGSEKQTGTMVKHRLFMK